MSGPCDNFVMEDQSCDCFDMIEFVQNFDMGINFLLGPPTPSEVIFIPSVDADGWLSWSNNGGLPNPDPVNIKGPPGSGAVESVNGKTGVVELTASDVDALPDTTPIPSKTSDLQNDSGFVTAAGAAAAAPVRNVNGKTGEVLVPYTNENLLDNWYFVGGGSQKGAGYFPINQKGQTSYSGNAETLDKWFCGNITSAISSGYVTFTNGNTYRDGFSQNLNKEVLYGKKLTGTILLSDGNLYTGTVTAPSTNVSSTKYFAFIDYSGNTIRLRCEVTIWMFESMIKASSSLSVVAAKLELGDSQTLAHQENGAWVLNEVPNFDEQLAIAQKHYYKISTGEFACHTNGDGSQIIVIVPNITRISPTSVTNASIGVFRGQNTGYKTSGFTYSSFEKTDSTILVKFTSNSAITDVIGYCTLSCELSG